MKSPAVAVRLPASPPAQQQMNTWLLSALLVVAVIGQRIVLPIGSFEVSVVLVVQYAILGALLLRGAITVSSDRLLFWGLVVAAVTISVTLAFAQEGSSLASFLLLVLAYAPLCACVLQPVLLERVIRVFQGLMLILALVGIGQVAGQVVGIPKYDPLALLPESFLSKSFHNHIRMAYDAEYFKADGMVFAEPSFFSQFLAFAILLHVYELVVSARVRLFQALQILVLAIAMFLTFSGTGVIALGLGLLWSVRGQRIVVVAGTLAALACLATLGLLSPWGQYFSSRLEEFQQEDSSAYRRFVNPYVRVVRATLADEVAGLIGHGPGTIDRLDEQDDAAADRDTMSLVVEEDPLKRYYERANRKEALSPSFIKCLYEYGIFALPLLAFLASCFWQGSSPAPLRLALFASLFFLGGNLLFVPLVAVCHILGTLRVTGEPAHNSEARQTP